MFDPDKDSKDNGSLAKFLSQIWYLFLWSEFTLASQLGLAREIPNDQLKQSYTLLCFSIFMKAQQTM